MAVRVLAEDSQYALEMNAAGTKLVVVDFTASWLVSSLWILKPKSSIIKITHSFSLKGVALVKE